MIVSLPEEREIVSNNRGFSRVVVLERISLVLLLGLSRGAQ
jgi:hypothetical protein